jgi:hypothetical protein
MQDNKSESESTRTDKNGKESFDSYSVKNSYHKIQLMPKKTSKPPFVMNPRQMKLQSQFYNLYNVIKEFIDSEKKNNQTEKLVLSKSY